MPRNLGEGEHGCLVFTLLCAAGAIIVWAAWWLSRTNLY